MLSSELPGSRSIPFKTRPPPLQLNVSFLRPVRPGRIIAKGRIVHRDVDLVFLEASLFGGDSAVITTATATAR